MKAHIRYLIMLAVAVIALTGMSLGQQFTYRVVANMPYDFYVGDQQFSAGDYTFAVNYGDRAVTITNQANGHSSVVLASPIEFASPGYVNRYRGAVVELVSAGGRYVLSDLQTRTNGVSFAKGSYPRTASNNEGTVTIAAIVR